ncbi:MAG: hypothetical protein IKS26_02665, partial [Paludibacteraceae bacterium]|nr:hypothetical protein [Paludibacteraceae bacterium]MBR6117454.1 hypothetical protein [Paludibacteraceae bacterium]
KDHELPEIIRQVVGNAPKNRKVAAFIACLAALCAMCPRVRLKYFFDSRLSALLLQVLIEGAQSSGKSFAADIEGLIMNDTLKARDKAMRRLEQEYRDKRKRRKANEKLEEEPETTIRVVPPTISKTVLTKRADMYERVYGDTLTFWMFAEELAQVTDAGKNGYSNLRTIMRTAYDLGSQFGIDFASDNSYSAIVDINICSMFCATPSAIDEYFDRKAIEGGNITRTILCRLDETLGEDGALFKPYTPEQKARIDAMLDRLMNETYDKDGGLQPTVTLDTQWLDKTVCQWVRTKGKEASLSGSRSLDVFRKRSSVSAFRVAALCQYLYELENALSPEIIQKRVRQIYLFMADYILDGMLERWGKRFEELNTKRENENRPGPRNILYDQLTDTFNREQLRALLEQQGKATPVKVFLSQWKKLRVIEAIDKDTFRKLKIEK